jgi:hypothetical protein
MHDGGTNLRLVVNGKTACNSLMFYDNGSGKIAAAKGASTLLKRDGPGAHSHGAPMAGTAHIAHPGSCTNYGDIKKGDQMQIEAYYDFSGPYAAMAHNGKVERLMGNCRVYIGPE